MKTNRNTFTEEKANSIFATKLRKLFAESGKTHGNLADYIEQRTGDSVTRQAIGQWCNGNTSPNLKTVPLIADFFSVSVDYLLTETAIKTTNPDVKAVCEYTGLSETACRNLHTLLLCAQGKQIKDSYKARYEEALHSHELSNTAWEETKTNKPELVEKMESLLEQNVSIYTESKEVQDIFFTYIHTEHTRSDIILIEDQSKNNAIHESEAIDVFLSSPDFYKFVNNLSIFVNTNFNFHVPSFVSIVKKDDINDDLDFDFNTKLLENALLLEMQNYIRSLKHNSPEYYIHEIEYDARNNEYLDDQEGGD